jgi:hypothetical protein
MYILQIKHITSHLILCNEPRLITIKFGVNQETEVTMPKVGRTQSIDEDSDDSSDAFSSPQLKTSKEIEKEIENFKETEKLLEETSKLLENMDDFDTNEDPEIVKKNGLSLVNDFMKQTSLLSSPPLSPLRISSEFPINKYGFIH